MKRILISLFIGLYQVLGFSQEFIIPERIVNIAEELAADEADPEASADYIDRLQELASSPVRINSSELNEIYRLFFLSDFQVKAINDYVNSNGRIISIFELANIPGFDKETVNMMIPFISLAYNASSGTDSARLRSTLITNFSLKPGPIDTSSLGSPYKILTKYKFVAGSFSGGFTVEKDQGEKFFIANSYCPDFMSANLSFNGKGIIRKVIIGDYSARFGSGVGINTGIRAGISATSAGSLWQRNEIKQYSSTDENNFFRGFAAELSNRNTGLTFFYSKNYADATLSSSSGLAEDQVESFYRTGIHNTMAMVKKTDAVSETVTGANLSWNFNNIRIGVLWAESRFSLPLQPEGRDPGNIFDFSGNSNTIYSLYYNSLIKRIILFGEFSLNERKKAAFVQGVSLRPSDRLTLNFLYRNYDPAYVGIHGRGPGINSVTGNERGISGNFTLEAAKHLFINAACDIYNYPWLRYRCSAPSFGKREEIRVRFLPNQNMIIEASYNYRSSMIDRPEDNGPRKQYQQTGRTLKGSLRYIITENITLQSRMDYKVSSPTGSRGMLIAGDIISRIKPVPVTIWFRYCIFNTGDWDSRLYVYENDLLYSFTIPALSGAGNRSYMMIDWKLGDFAQLRVKYSITTLVKESNSTSDSDEFKVQLKLWF